MNRRQFLEPFALNALRILQTVWALCLTAIAVLFVSDVQNRPRTIFLVMSAIYLLGCLGAWRDKRWAWRIALAVPALIFAWCFVWLSLGVYSVVRYGLGPILKLAATYSLPLLLPQVVVVALLWHNRADVLARMRRR